MKICRQQFKLFYLLFAFSCLGLLLFVPTTNAAITVEDITQANISNSASHCSEGNTRTITVPDYVGNALLVCESLGYYFQPDVYFDDATTTTITEQTIADGKSRFSYVENPTVGDHSVQNCSYQSYSSAEYGLTCKLILGADKTSITQISNIQQGYNDWSRSIGSLSVGSLSVLRFYQSDLGYPSDFTHPTNNLWQVYNNRVYTGNYYGISLYSIATSSNLFFSTSGQQGNGNPSSFGFTINESTSSPGLQIIDMTTLQDTYLWFDSPTTYCNVNSTCKLNYHFDTSIFNGSSDYAKVYYYQNSTSSPEYLGQILPIANQWELGELSGGYITATSSEVSTEFSYYAIVPCKTFGTGGCWGTSTVAVWFKEQPNYEEIISNFWPATSSTSTDLIDEFELNAYHLTCSEEEWKGDWWTQLGCGFRFGEIVLQQKAINILNRTMTKTWSYLKNVFPFNFINLVNTSWKNSSVDQVPEELSFLNLLDESGNISFDFSGITGATTTLKFWGPDTFNDKNGEFTKIKILSKYIFYGLFCLYVYFRGKTVYKEFIGQKNDE